MDLSNKKKVLLAISGGIVILIIIPFVIKSAFYSKADPVQAKANELLVAEEPKANTIVIGPSPLIETGTLKPVPFAEDPKPVVSTEDPKPVIYVEDPKPVPSVEDLKPVASAKDPKPVNEAPPPPKHIKSVEVVDSIIAENENAKISSQDTMIPKATESEKMKMSSEDTMIPKHTITETHISTTSDNTTPPNLSQIGTAVAATSESNVIAITDHPEDGPQNTPPVINPTSSRPDEHNVTEKTPTLTEKVVDGVSSVIKLLSSKLAAPDNGPDVGIQVKSTDSKPCGKVNCGTFDINYGESPKYRVFYAYENNINIQSIKSKLESNTSKGFRLSSVFGEIDTEEIKHNGAKLVDCWIPFYQDGPRAVNLNVEELFDKSKLSGFLGAYECSKNQGKGWANGDFFFILPISPVIEPLKLVNAPEIDYSSKNGSIEVVTPEIYRINEVKGWIKTTYELRARGIKIFFDGAEHGAIEIQFRNTKTAEKWPSDSINFKGLHSANSKFNTIAFEGLNVIYNYNYNSRDIIEVLSNIREFGAKDELSKQYGYGLGVKSIEFNALLIGPEEKLKEFEKQ